MIMQTSLASVENLTIQIGIVSRHVAKYAWNNGDVRLLLSMNGTTYSQPWS